MPLYNRNPGKRKLLVAKVDTRKGNSETFIKAGHKGYALALRIEDQQVLVKWDRISWASTHPISEIEFTG